MANLHAVYLTAKEVEDVARPILESDLQTFGFSDVEIAEDEDFAGAHVLRVIAHVDKDVPAADRIDITGRIGLALLAKGEERPVYLRTKGPDADDVSTPVDEDSE